MEAKTIASDELKGSTETVKKGSKHRTLRDSLGTSRSGKLCSVGELGPKPGELSAAVRVFSYSDDIQRWSCAAAAFSMTLHLTWLSL